MTLPPRAVIAGSIILGTILTSVVLLLRHPARADEAATTRPAEEENKAVATVKTVPLRVGQITQTIVAYGNVTAQPGEVAVYSLPLECRVKHVRVTGGQTVEKGTPLIEVEPSPDAKVQLIEARNALAAAKRELALAQQRFEMKLATNLELGQAQEAVKSAQIKLDALQERGAGEDNHVITAEGPGLVSKVDVQEGQIVPAGGSLVEVVSRDKIQVRLGVEQSEVARLHPDQAVQIFAVGGGSADGAPGKVQLITQRVNPDTRLVDVFVSPESHDSLLLDGFVRVELKVETKQAMVVPRDAVLPQEQDYTLFTVQDGHAVKRSVKLGLQNDKEVEVLSEQLKPGDLVVTLGNYELEDGMAVSGENSR